MFDSIHIVGKVITESLTVSFQFVFSSIQTFYGPRRLEREAEAEADPHHVHQLAAERVGASFRRDSLPGHLHARGAGSKNRSNRSKSAGLFIFKKNI